MERTEWFDYGVERGWISPIYCATHDGFAFIDEEDQEEWENGGDPCQPVVTVYEF